jgi:hypothetical protein
MTDRDRKPENDEYAMLCPTCGVLPVDHSDLLALRAALAEALEGWNECVLQARIAHSNKVGHDDDDSMDADDIVRVTKAQGVAFDRIAALRAKHLGGQP